MKKEIVIFGGSSKIAQDLCKKLCDEFSVTTISSQKISSNHRKIKNIQIKEYNEEGVINFVQTLNKKSEHIFLFMNGISDSKAFYKMNKEEISQIIKINYELPVLITNIIIKHLILAKTKYIYFSSSRALLSDRGISLYSSSKSAIKFFARSLSLEYGKFNHFFYTISLGLFQKGLVKKVNKTELEKMMKRSAIRDYVEIDELASAVKFISSNDASTGSVLNIDNGFF